MGTKKGQKRSTARRAYEEENKRRAPKGFMKWFSTRFGSGAGDPLYKGEWIRRFRGGSPESYMDAQSKKVYKKGQRRGWFD